MELELSFACGQYDRTIPLQDGTVKVEGARLNFMYLAHRELFRRQARNAEFDVSEFSLSTLTILISRGDRRLVGIPVFPLRRFRHGEIFVNAHAGIQSPQDLRGKRIGVEEFQATANVWIRGILHHEYGVSPDQVTWVIGPLNQPERYEPRIPLRVPFETAVVPDGKCLSDMLDEGELDAVIGPRHPRCFLDGSPNVRRLFPNYKEVEQEYFRRTGIFPIMHTVVIRRELYERHRWLAVSLYKAFVKAKEVGMERLAWAGSLYVMLPWLMDHLEETRRVMGPDPFPYGLEASRRELEVFTTYAYEQGLTERKVEVEELFAPETHGAILMGLERPR